MKCLVVAKTIKKGGAASGARNLLAALRAAGADVVAVDAYIEQRTKPIRLVRTLERLYERSFHGAETHCLRLGPPVFDLKRLYAEYRPDVIQLCDVSGNTIRFADIARVPCPVIHRMSDFWPYHGAHHYAEQAPQPFGLSDRALRYTIFDGSAMPDCRVAPSHWLASRLGGSDIRVIRNAVSVPEGIAPRSIGEHILRFGFISGQIMDPRKGFPALARFVAAVAARSRRTVQLHAFGRTHDGRLPDISKVDVVLHPAFSREDLARVYSSFDILLCPSRLDNSPNVVTEALAYGVPVIGQSGTGMESYIRPEVGGLVDFHNSGSSSVYEFQDIVQRISEHYSHFSERARRYAKEDLSPDVIGSKYLSLYEELLVKGYK